ncbi:MAG: hypothetical protein ACOX4U_05765 [Anaerovoracaceae bacterium]|jgi:hypothetical protein
MERRIAGIMLLIASVLLAFFLFNIAKPNVIPLDSSRSWILIGMGSMVLGAASMVLNAIGNSRSRKQNRYYFRK